MTERPGEADRLRYAITKLTDDLAWRGPGGRVMGFVVLPRELAEVVLVQLKRSTDADQDAERDDQQRNQDQPPR